MQRLTRHYSNVALVLMLSVGLTVPVMAGKKTKKPSHGEPEVFPAAVGTLLPAARRFADPGYFRLMAAAGLATSVQPERLFERMSIAASAGENYKALYFARLLTRRDPNMALAWQNRSHLAASLGLQSEAVAAAVNAQNPMAPGTVPASVLPGAFAPVRPVSLADWAGAMALMAEDLSSTGNSMAAVNDIVSGIYVSKSTSNPYCKGEEVQLGDVLPNIYAVSSGKPMKKKSMNFAAALLAGLAAADSTQAMQMGDYDRQVKSSEIFGESMARATNVQSELKGGRFVIATFPAGKVKSRTVVPFTCGKKHAQTLPFPLLWATGHPLAVSFPGTIAVSGKQQARVAGKNDSKARSAKMGSPKNTRILKLASIRLDGEASPRLSLQELLLSADDVRALAPVGSGDALVQARPAALDALALAYVERPSSLDLGAFDRTKVIAIDGHQTAYEFTLDERLWAVPAAI